MAKIKSLQIVFPFQKFGLDMMRSIGLAASSMCLSKNYLGTYSFNNDSTRYL